MLWVLLLAPGAVPGETRALEPVPAEVCGGGDRQSLYAFARFLYQEEHWDQALTELQRFCFLCPGDDRVPGAKLLIGECYEKMGRFAEAAAAYRTVAEELPESPDGMEARVRIGESWYRDGKYEEARVELGNFLDRDPPEPWKGRALYRTAWSSLKLHAFSVAREQFSDLALQPGPYRKPSQEVIAVLNRIRDLPYRSPVLAGVLSGVLPGAGQLYAGEAKDALLSFLVNGALIAATYGAFDQELYGVGGVVCAVGLSFYAGNVYGAVNSAHHANRDRLSGALTALEKKVEWVLDQ